MEGPFKKASSFFYLFLLPCVFASASPITDKSQQNFRQGLAYERLGRLNEAYTELQLATTLETNNAEMALALGLVASRLGRYDAAQRALERSVELDANSIGSYFQLALIYEHKQMTDRALDCWHRFLALSQDDLLKQVAQKHIRQLEMP